MLMVREQTRHRSRVTMKTRHVLVCQYMRETFGAEAGFPSYRTFCRVWREWFGPGGARPRYDRLGRPAGEGRRMSWCTGPGRSSRWTPRCCR